MIALIREYTFGLEDVFSDILVESRIVMSEDAVSVEKNISRIDELLEKYSSLGFHKIVFEYSGTNGRETFKLYRFKDLVLAAILESSKGRITGVEAIKSLNNYLSSGKSVELVRVFKIKDELLREILGEEKYREIVESAKKTEAEKPVEKTSLREEKIQSQVVTEKPVVESTVVAEKAVGEVEGRVGVVMERVDYRRAIKRIIDELGLEEIYIDVREEPESTKIVVELNPLPTWISLRSILYAVIAAYLKNKSGREYPAVKAEVKMGDQSESILLIKQQELLIARIIGEILHHLSKNGIPVKDTDYQLDEKNNLIIILKVKKPVYPGVTIKDTLREIYEKVKTLWPHKLVIKAKKGKFSEVKIP